MTASVIGALRVNLSIDSADLKRGLTEAERMAQRFSRALGSTLRTGALALATGATAATVALVALTKSSMETISAQVDLANRVGASVAAIQSLQHAAMLSGASQEALAKTLGTLNARLGEAAREGAGPAYEALQRLGLSARELSEMDADVRIAALSDRMKELGLSTQQQADTLKQLGVRQQEIINLFQEGSGAIAAARQELKDWGVLLSDVDAAKVEQAGDAWDKIGTIFTGIGNQLAVRLSPLIQGAAQYLDDAATAAGGFGGAIDYAINLALRLVHGLNVEWHDFLKSVYMTGDALTEFVNNAAKPGQGLLRRILGMDEIPESEITGLLDNTWKPLLQQLGTPPSMEEWEAWWAEMQKKAREAAEAAIQAGKPGGGGAGGTDEATQKQREQEAEELAQYQEHLSQKLVALQESLMTEREAEMADYEQRLADLATFRANQVITDQQYADLRSQIEADHADKVRQINEDVARENERNARKQRDVYFGIADDISSALGSLFGDSKAWAIAEAIINTATAITKALAVYGPTPQGFAAAAAGAAAGAAQLAAIRSTSHKGGGGGRSPSASGGGAGASGGATQPAPQAGSNQTLYVSGLSNDQLLTGEYVRAFAERLIEFQRDGGKVVLAPA